MGEHRLPPDEPPSLLYIGQHESQRASPVTTKLLGQAQLSGYDLLTAPLTTSRFQSRVLARLEEYVQQWKSAVNLDAVPLPTITPLMPEDTDLSPEESNTAFVGIVSPWIDLGSRDPLIASVSRQVFNLEVAYAAFVGVSNVVVHGPMQGSDTVQYARAIAEGLGLGPYIQLQILMPMTGELDLEGSDGAHLSELARDQYHPDVEYDEDDEDDLDLYETWETWNTVRSICAYSTKLTVGMFATPSSSNFSYSIHIFILLFITMYNISQVCRSDTHHRWHILIHCNSTRVPTPAS